MEDEDECIPCVAYSFRFGVFQFHVHDVLKSAYVLCMMDGWYVVNLRGSRVCSMYSGINVVG